jgi:hypothetical protein
MIHCVSCKTKKDGTIFRQIIIDYDNFQYIYYCIDCYKIRTEYITPAWKCIKCNCWFHYNKINNFCEKCE